MTRRHKHTAPHTDGKQPSRKGSLLWLALAVLALLRSRWLLWVVLIAIAAWGAWMLSPPTTEPALSDSQTEQLDHLAIAPATEGNRVIAFSDYDSMLNTMLSDIALAQHNVNMQFFKFEDDSIGRLIAVALCSSAARGIDCRLLYDALMCRQWQTLYDDLHLCGVQTAGYEPVTLPFIGKRGNYRNHRKIVVIDGQIAYVGGMNIAQRYSRGLTWGTWNDLMVRIEGPAVAALQKAFVTDWCYATDSLPPLHALFPTLAPQGSSSVAVVASGPTGYGPQIADSLAVLISSSQHYVYLESPYFIPTRAMRDALYSAARRGVDIRVLQPPHGDDGETPQHASHYYYDEALAAGISIGQYQAGFLHTKLTVIDDSIAIVGSANIDPRSHHLNQEIVAIVRDTTFAKQMRHHFEQDEAASLYIDPSIWSQRPRWTKIKEWAAHLIAPQL